MRFKDLVVPGLEGEVDVLADPGQLGDGVDQVRAHVVGVGGEEADALQSGQVVQAPEEEAAREVGGSRSSRRRHRLPQEDDLLGPLGQEPARFVQDLRGAGRIAPRV